MTEVPYDIELGPVHLERANLDVLRGRPDAAHLRLSTLRDDSRSMLYRSAVLDRVDLVSCVAAVDLWDARPERALSLVTPFLDDFVGTEGVALVGPTFALAARAAADVVERDPQSGRARSFRA